MKSPSKPAHSQRREFLKTSSVVATAAMLPGLQQAAYAQQAPETIKMGLVGCGGRGTGAARDALSADANVELVAVGDMFEGPTSRAISQLTKTEFADRIKVTQDTTFTGFDAYKKVINSGVDVVLLATPPGFRPLHVEACVEAGKHVFCEKPVAVDPTGIRKVWEACQKAKEKNLSVVSGLCWRYEDGMNEIIKRIHEGQIGDVQALYSTRYNQGVEKRAARTAEMTEMEYQLRNWYYFTWLSADFFAEQFVHELDKMSWVLGDVYPTRVLCTGGRETRTGEENGNVFDHFAACFYYESGLRYYATSRQQRGCTSEFQDFVVGNKGTADLMKYQIKGENEWRIRKNVNQMYLREHQALFKSIRSGETINNGEYMCNSSMMGIMARMSAYTGKEVTWKQAWESKLDLSPSEYTMQGTPPSSEVSVPGATELI